MKFWFVTYTIKKDAMLEHTKLISADDKMKKSQIRKVLKEVHPEWHNMLLKRAKKPSWWKNK
jgi:hypothetical protein